MYSTGIFTTHNFKMSAKRNEVTYLIPFGDVHRFAPNHDRDRWHEFLDWAAKKPNCYFLGMGDYMDMISCSERKILDGELHDSTEQTLDEFMEQRTKEFADELSFMKGKLIGMIEGNHYWQFGSGDTSTMRLCSYLKCKYLGVSAFIHLMIYNETEKSFFSTDVWAHHGKGASKLIGGSLNRVEDMGRIADANIYLAGHDHRKSVGLGSKLTLRHQNGTTRLVHKKQIFARTGSFLKGYVDGKKSYVADACLSPTDLGVVKIELTLFNKMESGVRERGIDIHASI